MIKCEGVIKRYKTLTLSYNDLIFKEGMTLLVGTNGSGKTTLLKAIAGLHDYEGFITPVEAFYMGSDDALPELMRVDDYLKQIGTLQGGLLEGLIAMFSLQEKLPKRIASLSKGMRQKVRLIAAISNPSTWIMMDEPLDGLDDVSKNRFISALKHHKKRAIIATHSIPCYARLNPEVIRL